MRSGRTFRCTPDHLWRSKWTYGTQDCWVRPEVGRTIVHVVDPSYPPTELKEARLAAWLGGIYDGEGSCSRQAVQISQDAQHNPLVYASIASALDYFGFDYREYDDKFYLRGGRATHIKFLNITQPFRRAAIESNIFRFNLGRPDVIESVVPDGEGPVISMQTTTGNYVAWGYASKNCQIMYDPDVSGRTGMGPFIPTEAQELVLGKIAKMEAEQTEAYERGQPVNGILLACHKSRQLGYTMLFRTLLVHRITTTKGTRALSASINEDKNVALADRDDRLLDNLPPFLRPSVGYREKAKHMKFDLLDTMLMYQELVQRSGIAQGDQWDVGHLTEVASVPGLDFEIQHQYEPTIPRAPISLHGLETTPQGRNNWWRFFVEDIRKGYSRWSLSATPWYAELRKYRAQPPVGWKPSQQSLLHAQQVYNTSPEYVGKRVMLPPENLYWWEFTRADYQRKGNLAAFYTNYWAVIEESFQHVEQSAFDPETLERLRGGTSQPQGYALTLNGGGNA